MFQQLQASVLFVQRFPTVKIAQVVQLVLSVTPITMSTVVRVSFVQYHFQIVSPVVPHQPA